MGERTRLGLGVFGAAAALGVLGDLLLREAPWGINFFFWVAALVGAAAALAAWAEVPAAGEGRWLIPVAVLFAAGVALRDSAAVVALDVLAVCVAVSLAALRGRAGSLRRAGIVEYLLGGLRAGASAAMGPVPAAIGDVRWAEVGRSRGQVRLLAVARGGLIATPLLLLFGALLMAADAAFEDLVLNAFSLDADAVGHLLLALFVAWISAGLLTFALLARDKSGPEFLRPEGVSLGTVELFVVLYLLDALFLVFVAVQAKYLFGGAGRVSSVAGLTYAAYARHGFFELVAVAALVLPVLLVAHRLFRPESRSQGRKFKVLCNTMVALLGVIGASALQRMYLYYDEFGLSVLRYCATVFMAWLAVLFVLFLLTVMRGKSDRFAFGALVSGLAIVLSLNIASPDAVVARVNIERAENGERFDAYYLTSLSADAAPVLVDALPEMEDERVRDLHSWRLVPVEQAVVDRWEAEPDDWRSWNLGRARAEALVEPYATADHLPRGENAPK